MSVRPLPTRPNAVRRPGQQLVAAAAARIRRPPAPGRLARRRLIITLTKWLLPACALVLLASIALWPELGHLGDATRVAYQRVSGDLGGATLTNAHYRGVDQQGRPYTLTAAIAQQEGSDRINLTTVKADTTLSSGTWLMLQAKNGVFLQHSNQLDLSHDVTLYRDDGTTVVTNSATIDLKNGAAAGNEPTHSEGPFGTLDAQGFMVTDKGAAIQFIGPAHLVLNGSSQ